MTGQTIGELPELLEIINSYKHFIDLVKHLLRTNKINAEKFNIHMNELKQSWNALVSEFGHLPGFPSFDVDDYLTGN